MRSVKPGRGMVDLPWWEPTEKMQRLYPPQESVKVQAYILAVAKT